MVHAPRGSAHEAEIAVDATAAHPEWTRSPREHLSHEWQRHHGHPSQSAWTGHLDVLHILAIATCILLLGFIAYQLIIRSLGDEAWRMRNDRQESTLNHPSIGDLSVCRGLLSTHSSSATDSDLSAALKRFRMDKFRQVAAADRRTWGAERTLVPV